jgi:hypothetical protein
MSNKQIGHFLTQLCDTAFEGGRLVMGDSDTVLIYDVPSWPGTRTDALRQRFPHCDVDIHQAQNNSASGFVVVVTARDPVSYFHVFCTVFVSIGLAGLAAIAATHVFLADHPDWGNVNLYDYHTNGSCSAKNTVEN